MYSRESPKFYIDRKAWHTFGIDNVLRTKTYAPDVKTTRGRNYYYEKPTAACSTHRIVFAPTLKEAMNTPGMSQWDVQRAQAAVKAQEAQMAGTEYDLQHALDTINKNKAYEDAGGTPNQSGRTWDGH